MPLNQIQTAAVTGKEFLAARHPRPCETIIADELNWRRRPLELVAPSAEPRVTATRWRALEERPQEVSAEAPDDSHMVAIALRTISCRFSVSGRIVQDGVAMAGMMHVTEPAAPSRCQFRGPYDVLHLHVPNSLIAECGRDIPIGEVAALRSEPTLIRDATTERLGWALIGADQIGGSFARVYADALSTAIVARLLSATLRSHSTKRPSGSGLPKWRLKRAIDYIEAHLAETVSLADIASSTGLTRMHFAAQFKAATGLRPHEYLLRRRIERAQEMLVGDGMPVVDVALSVGFQTQSHFTTVFTRFVGQPPQAWRHSHA